MGTLGNCCCGNCECECFSEPPDVTIPGWTASSDWSNNGCCCWVRTYTKDSPTGSTCIPDIQTLEYTVTEVEKWWALLLPQPMIVTSTASVIPACPVPTDRCCIPDPAFEVIKTCTTTGLHRWRVDFNVNWEYQTLYLYYGRLPLECDSNPEACKYFLAYKVQVDYDSVAYAQFVYDDSGTGTLNSCFVDGESWDTTPACACTEYDCDDTVPPAEEACTNTTISSASGSFVFSRMNLYDSPLTTGSYAITGTPTCVTLPECLANIDQGFIAEYCIGTGVLCIELWEPDINADTTTITVSSGPCSTSIAYNNCDPDEGCTVATRICSPETTCSDRSKDFTIETTSGAPPDDGCTYLEMIPPVCTCEGGQPTWTKCAPLVSQASCTSDCCWIFDCKYPTCYACYPKYDTGHIYQEIDLTFSGATNGTFTESEVCISAPSITAVFP